MLRLLVQCCQQYRRQRWFGALVCLGLVVGAAHMLAWQAMAEGSRTMYPAGIAGYRANIEWRTSFYGTFLRRRTLFNLYAQSGDVVLLGSSAVGVGQGDILIYNPGQVSGPVGDENIPATADFSCAQQRAALGNPDQGRIRSRAQELAGPDTIVDPNTAAPGNVVPSGYVPCFYIAPETGVYNVVFYGPLGGNSDSERAPTGEIELTSPDNFDDQQFTSVAAWDVTVRSSLTSTDDINGRLFADYVTQFTGANPRPVYSTLFAITRDGYQYQTDLRGLDPNGFILYANDVGFLDSDGSPLFHDVVADPRISGQEQNQLNVLLGGVSLAPPAHLIFFNRPADPVIEALGIPTTPITPRLDEFSFAGVLGENDTYVGAGGTFSYSSNVGGIYRLIISQDGINFDPSNPRNRLMQERHEPGVETIVWDGLDNEGLPFPPGQGYPAQLIVRAGEHHFPILDSEASLEGGPTYTLLNPPGGNCPSFNGQPANCQIGFYDDRGYRTASGEMVGSPGSVLPGAAPPDPPNSDLLAGFDTSSPQRRFGDGRPDGFGDKKGLDLWTFFPSEPRMTTIDILPLNIALSKTDGGIETGAGETLVYQLTYTNTTLVPATGVVITEVVPLYTTFNPAASGNTNWSCAGGGIAGTTCLTTIGDLPGGATGTVNFGLTVVDPVPDGIDRIENVAVIGEDGTHGPEPPADNTALDDTPLRFETATPTPTPTWTSTPMATITSTPVATLTPPTAEVTVTPSATKPRDNENNEPPAANGGPPAGTPVKLTGVTPTPVPPLPVLMLPETGSRPRFPGLPLLLGVVILGLLLAAVDRLRK